jgi:nucleotide-binding universal stress UspA family protein
VGYDGSPAADAALRWAAETAGLRGQSVRALVVDPMRRSLLATHEWPPDSELPTRVDRILTAAGVSGSAERRPGEVGPTLLQEAAHVDLLVVGSQGHGWAAETVRGSVSQLLARRAPCPVVVVRAPARPDAARIVVGVDGSDESRAALEFACHRADLTRETVVALHAWKAAHVDLDRHGELPSAVGERAEAAELALAELSAGLQNEHPTVTLEVETIAVPPAVALTEASATASLVVTGSRGHGALTGLLLGSVSHHLLHRAHCPVAVVRPHATAAASARNRVEGHVSR